MNVHDYLEAAGRRRWRWGGGATGFEGDDCTLFAANWAKEVCGEDPGVGIRSSYSTQEEAVRIVVRAGGFAAFIDQQLRPLGWIRTGAEPRDGDIGIVMAPTLPDGAMKPAPAIRAGGLWVGRSIHGQVAKLFETVTVWRYGDFSLRDLGPPAPTEYQNIIRSRSQQIASGTNLRTEQEQQTGFLESIILFSVTALAPGLSNWAIGAITSAITGLATTAITTGISFLFMPKPPLPQDGKAPRAQAMPYIIFGVGTNRVGGSLMLWESKGLYLHMVSAFAGHRVSAIQRYYLHDDEVTLDVDQFVEEGEDGRYSDSGRGLILWRHRLGLATETPYPEQVADFSGEGLWTNDHRGDGQASYAVRAESVAVDQMQQRFPHQIPQPSIVADMALVWDFRDDEQDPEDDDTWVFSKNPALCLAWWLCFCPYGPQWDYTKAIVPVLERWQEEADICDEAIALNAGGTEPRYAVNGWATTETDPIAILNSFLAACDGHLAQHGDGTLVLTVGKFREELVETITDADIVGHFIQYDVPEEDETNRLVPKFTYPATDYTTAVTDYFESVPDQTVAGRVLSQDAELSWIQSWRQARRVAKREWLRIQQKKSGSFDLRLSAINAVYARWIRLDTPVRLPSMDGDLIENRRSILALQQGGFQMEWKKHPANIDDWNPATDEGSAPPVPSKPDADELFEPTIDTVAAVSNGTSVYIRVVIIDPDNPSLIPMTRYRVKDTGGGTPGAWIEQAFPDVDPAAGVITLNTNPVPTDQVLQVQAAFRASGGTPSDWGPTTPEEVTSIVDTVAPMALSSFGATGGLGRASLTFTTASDSHLKNIAIYRVPAGVTLDKNVHSKITIAAAPGTTFGYTDGDATRTNLALTPDFASDTNWTKDADWTIAAGVGHKAAGGANRRMFQLNTPPSGTAVGRYQHDVLNWTASNFFFRLQNGTTAIATSPARAANGTYRGTLTNGGIGANAFGFFAAAAAAGDVDNAVFFWETPACAPQGVWDYYAFPLNGSGVEGPGATPVTNITII